MKFSKEAFLKNAPSGIKRQLKDHLDYLDGIEVDFSGRFGEYGYIEQYFKDGQQYYIYPVYKSWCVDDSSQIAGQINIFELQEAKS